MSVEHETAAEGLQPVPLLLLTVEEAARRINVGRTTMYGLVKTGAVHSVTIGRLRRIEPEALDDYVRSLSREPGAA